MRGGPTEPTVDVTSVFHKHFLVGSRTVLTEALMLQESGTYWFNPSSLESDSEFMLLGLVAGLAIYNGAQLSPMLCGLQLRGMVSSGLRVLHSHCCDSI